MYFACIVLVASAFSLGGARAACCWPSKWEGGEGVNIGITKGEQTHLIEGYLFVHYDYDNKMIAVDEDVFRDGKEMKAKLIRDYKSKIQYSIANGVCTRQKLPGPMISNCILKNATKLGSYYMGMANKIQMTSYSFPAPHEHGKVSMTVSDDESCVLIGSIKTGSSKKRGDYLAAIGFVNMTPGIKDPSVFKIPDICKQSDDLPKVEVYLYSVF
ncbi:hypothetical protein ScPMuIL_004918 [Solemya velum]